MIQQFGFRSVPITSPGEAALDNETRFRREVERAFRFGDEALVGLQNLIFSGAGGGGGGGAGYLPLSGGTMSGYITLHAAPTAPMHAATKAYVDAGVGMNPANYYDKTASDARFVNISGDTMTGLLTLSGAPSLDLHSATKKYVDDKVAAGGGTVDWTNITGKPATFPPTLPIPQSGVTNLVTDLAGKAPTVHTHAQSDITGLVTALSGKEPTIAAGTTTQYWRGDKSWQTLPTGGGGASTAVSATPPGSPAQGDFWFSTVEPVGLFVWYIDVDTGQWVQANGSGSVDAGGYLPLTGGTLTGPLLIENAAPALRWHETDAPGGAGLSGCWQISASGTGGYLAIYAMPTDFSASIATFMTLAVAGYNSVAWDRINLSVPISSTITLKSTGPQLAFDEYDQTSPAGQYRHYVSGDVYYFQRALTADHVTNTNVWSYAGATNELTIGAAMTTTIGNFTLSNTGPQFRIEEIDQTDPAGRYRFYAGSGNFYFQRATAADWGGSTSVWSYVDSVFNIWSPVYANSTLESVGTAKLATTSGAVEVGQSAGATISFMRTTSVNYLKLPAAASLRVQTSDTAVAWATVASASGWTAGSDQRLKKDIVPIPYGLAEVLKLRPKRFRWKSDDRQDIGLLAHQVRSIIPEVVVTYADDPDQPGPVHNMLGMHKDGLIPVLIRAIQELHAEVMALKKAKA